MVKCRVGVWTLDAGVGEIFYPARCNWEDVMSPQKINPEVLRSILLSAGKKLKETLLDLESEDLDDEAVSSRIKEVQKEIRKIPGTD
jgi:hypothetical protein